MTEYKRATMKEVAKEAGVTIGTVSNVMNNPDVVAPDTIEKVKDAMEHLNYVPNTLARNMRRKKNKIIGLLIPNLANNFYSGITTELTNKAYEDGYTILILGFEYSIDKEKQALKILYENNVETIIVVNGQDDEKILKSYIERNINIILVDRRTEVEGISYIEYENKKVIDELIKKLKEFGYQKIGFVSEPLKMTNLQDRFSAYVKALNKYGYKFRSEYVYLSKALCLNNAENGYLHMKNILEEKKKEELPDVFIVSSDFQAIGVQNAILEKGYIIPEDFGVVGCDNISITKHTKPRLTTIHQDREILSEKVWKMVKKKHNSQEVSNEILPQKLVLRDSI